MSLYANGSPSLPFGSIFEPFDLSTALFNLRIPHIYQLRPMVSGRCIMRSAIKCPSHNLVRDGEAGSTLEPTSKAELEVTKPVACRIPLDFPLTISSNLPLERLRRRITTPLSKKMVQLMLPGLVCRLSRGGENALLIKSVIVVPWLLL